MEPATTLRLEQLAMRTKASDAQEIVAYFAVNQQQVGPDVAFAIARPFAEERVIAQPRIQRDIGRKSFEGRGKLRACGDAVLCLRACSRDERPSRQFNRSHREATSSYRPRQGTADLCPPQA